MISKSFNHQQVRFFRLTFADEIIFSEDLIRLYVNIVNIINKMLQKNLYTAKKLS